MPIGTSPNGSSQRIQAPLNFLRAAFCPLDFKAVRLKDHPKFLSLKKPDAALERIEVGESLIYPRQFRYKDANGNSKYGTQTVTAPFGLAPRDFDLLLWIVDYWKNIEEQPEDGELHLPLSFIARKMGLSINNKDDRTRLASRIFRLSFANFASTAFWYPAARSYDIANFSFFGIRSMSRMLAPYRPIVLQLDRTFMEIVRESNVSYFDWDFYRGLSSDAERRFYLVANQQGYKRRHSFIFAAQEFCIDQLGMTDSDRQKLAELKRGGKSAKLDSKDDRSKLRRQKLRKLISNMEDLDVIRPQSDWGTYFHKAERGLYRGTEVLGWDRGPRVATETQAKQRRQRNDVLDDDPLYDQIKVLTDEEGSSVPAGTYVTWVNKFGRDHLQKHIRIVAAQIDYMPHSFKKSSVHTFVDRLNKDYADPDWFIDLNKKDQIAMFDEIEPGTTAKNVYETAFV